MHGRLTRGTRARRFVRGTALAVVLAPALVALQGAVGGVSPVHAAGTVEILPGDDLFPDFPDCGSKNIDTGVVRFRTSIGSGSTVFVGQKITIKASLNNTILDSPNGNDGPDPLTLKLVPSGLLSQAAPTVGSEVDYQTAVTFAGGGFTGPVGPVGKWGYEFDANSSPGFSSSDGTNEMITISFTATAPGDINVQKLEIDGWDATPKAAAVHCAIFPGIFYHVIPLQDPDANIDFAYVDARYSQATAADATTGRHEVAIDVLANDSDPNESYGLDLDHDVRLVSWGPALDCGPGALNGVTPTKANFDDLAKGPCTYRPVIDDELPGGTSYTMVQRSGLKQASSEVIVNVVPNSPPVVIDEEVEMLVNSSVTNVSALPLIDDPDTDALVCSPTSATSDIGTFSISGVCDYTFTYPFFAPAEATATYLACDTHPTLQDGDTGDATRLANYDKDMPGSDHDLSPTATRRCAQGTILFHIKANAPDLLPAIQVKNDVDSVDAGYPIESPVNGPYKLQIPVLDNDSLLGGSVTSLSFTPPLPSGTATAGPNNTIKFFPADFYVGPVFISYKVCVDIGNPAQNVCKSAKVIITVKGNKAPVPLGDNLGVLDKQAHVRSLVANDKEPELEALLCKTTLMGVNPAAFASIALGANCQLTFQANAGFNGQTSFLYKVCDNHTLLNPKWDDPAGYGPFDIPGGNAPRCSLSGVEMTFEDPAAEPVPPVGPNNGPTCVDDAFVTVANVNVTGDVVANDSDLDEQNQPSAVSLLDPDEPGTAQGGTVMVEGGQLKYAPKAGFVGVDQAPYSAIDTDGHGCAATVTYTVKADSDGDGIPNDVDPDVDGDGIPNGQDPDIDGDGIPNDQDSDMDGDGIPNDQDSDMDGDGVPNDQDPDDNSDGVDDSLAPTTSAPVTPMTMPAPGFLPETGSSSNSGLIAAGLVLIAGGAGLLAAARRRPARARAR
jgi:LPXTG-motif cell wall-anchored protein